MPLDHVDLSFANIEHHWSPADTYPTTRSADLFQNGPICRDCRSCEQFLYSLTQMKGTGPLWYVDESTTNTRYHSPTACRDLKTNLISGPLPQWSSLSGLQTMWAERFSPHSNEDWPLHHVDYHSLIAGPSTTRSADLFRNGPIYQDCRSCK